MIYISILKKKKKIKIHDSPFSIFSVLPLWHACFACKNLHLWKFLEQRESGQRRNDISNWVSGKKRR